MKAWTIEELKSRGLIRDEEVVPMTDIVKRLRAASKDERLACGALYAEAADEIERLRDENERLRTNFWAERKKVEQFRKGREGDE